MKQALVAALILAAAAPGARAEVRILNVACDVTREFYRDFKPAFAARWKARTGEAVTVNQSHGASSKPARSVADGLGGSSIASSR